MNSGDSYNEVHALIKKYISCAKYSCALLKSVYKGGETLLRAKVLKLIPKEGYIENVYYTFHGVGCYFEYEDFIIDIDFGPNDRCDGFDLFRIKDFLQSLRNQAPYNILLDDTIMEQQFQYLKDQNIITNLKLEPSPHLYYLTTE